MSLLPVKDLKVEVDLEYQTGDTFDFEDNFKNLQYSSIHAPSISLYMDYGNLPEHELSDIVPTVKDNQTNLRKMVKYCIEEGYGLFDTIKEGMDEWTIDDILDHMEMDEYDEYIKRFDKMGVTYESEWEWMTSTGHSQGDFAYIVISKDDFKKMHGVDFDPERHQDYFDHLFWDSPISGEIRVSFNYHHNAVPFKYAETFVFREVADCNYEEDSINTEAVIKMIEKEIKFPCDLSPVAELINDIDYEDVEYPRCAA